MNVCSNFTLSLTGSFQECRNCGRDKKFHRLDFESNNIEYIQKSNNQNAAKFQQDKLQEIAAQKLVEEDEMRAKACKNFVLALVGQFQQCGNCKIEKKYHKLDTSGQIAYQPKSQLTKSVQQTQQQTKPTAVAEVVQETMMVQSVKDRIAQMNKKNQSTNEPQFRPSVKREEVKEKTPGQAEIVTEQVFTSVSDKKSVFDKQRIRKTIEQSAQQIREQQNTEGFRKAESKYITSSEDNQQQEQFIQNQIQENNQEDTQQNYQQEQQYENNKDQQQYLQEEQQQEDQQQNYQEEQQQNYQEEQQQEYQEQQQEFQEQQQEFQEQQQEFQEQQQQEHQEEQQQENMLQKQEQEEPNNQNEQVEQFQQQNDQQEEGQQDNQQQEEANEIY